MALKLDHLTICVSSAEAYERHYGLLLPLAGFTRVSEWIWTDGSGFYLQFRKADEGTRAYERYGAGLNHWGFSMPSPQAVEQLREALIAGGFDAQPIQHLHGAHALFVPDPDGLRAEFSWYPEGMPPVG